MIGVAIGVILGVTGFTALTVAVANAADKKKKYLPATVQTQNMSYLAPIGPKAAPKGITPEQITFLKDFIVKMALKRPWTAAERTQAYNIAMSAGLARTARAIANESSLPLDEKWPGTDMSVVDYFKSLLGF